MFSLSNPWAANYCFLSNCILVSFKLPYPVWLSHTFNNRFLSNGKLCVSSTPGWELNIPECKCCLKLADSKAQNKQQCDLVQKAVYKQIQLLVFESWRWRLSAMLSGSVLSFQVDCIIALKDDKKKAVCSLDNCPPGLSLTDVLGSHSTKHFEALPGILGRILFSPYPDTDKAACNCSASWEYPVLLHLHGCFCCCSFRCEDSIWVTYCCSLTCHLNGNNTKLNKQFA